MFEVPTATNSKHASPARRWTGRWAARSRRRPEPVVLLVLLLASCVSTNERDVVEETKIGAANQALQLDPSFEGNGAAGSTELPASDYTLFEADPVRPVAVLDRIDRVAVVNTVDDRLEFFSQIRGGLSHCGQVKVGLRPVAVAVVRESASEAELWVTNHLSDSVSVVRLDAKYCDAEVIDTLHVGDEPRDVVVARTRRGKRRVFVATAHRGQHHPTAGARSGADLFTPPAEKQASGLADVLVFDPDQRRAVPEVVNLFSDVPRALAVGRGVVYAAGFRTGNRTTVVPAGRVIERGLRSLAGLLARDSDGEPLEVEGRLVLAQGATGRIEGGLPAVVGRGRCLPDPRVDRRDESVQQLCIATDGRHRVTGLVEQVNGQVSDSCQCTSGDGTLQPTTGVVVAFHTSRRVCGVDFRRFADGSQGCWLDSEPGGATTPAAHADATTPPMAWNDDVKLSLPDQDVFAIGVDDLRVRRSFAGVGTVLFGMAVQPRTGKVFVTNTDASNLTRFEGHGEHSSTSVIGHLHESRITIVDPDPGRGRRGPVVRSVHLNDHIDYSTCCERIDNENERSFAFPTAGAFSEDGRDFYFTALGSNKLGLVRSRALEGGFDHDGARRTGALREISFGNDLDQPAGPVGLAVDARRGRLYVKTHFTNELVVVDTRREEIAQRLSLPSPEPESIRRGRHVLYNARLTSSHGDSACASCHVFGDLDGLAWDLGDPGGATVTNAGPYRIAPEHAALGDLALDPLGLNPVGGPITPDFRSNKGPMTTQTLRGMANHGAMHWRGDRSRNFQDAPGEQPNSGNLNEDNSFGEFDVAIAGLNGNDQTLPPEVFQAFTNFALQITLPPNPVRALNNVLDDDQQQARALYFGCTSMTDEQFEAGECIGKSGLPVDIEAATRNCTCVNNPAVSILKGLPGVLPFAALLVQSAELADHRETLLDLAAQPGSLPPGAVAELDGIVQELDRNLRGLVGVDMELEQGLLSLAAAESFAGVSGSLLSIVQLHSAHSSDAGTALLGGVANLLASLPGAPTLSPEAVGDALGGLLSLSNINRVVVLDEQVRATGSFRGLLSDCNVAESPVCDLRATDTLQTCHGCHTLDPNGNAEFEVYRPGFFGTSGAFSFEAESQVFKIPHLRNAYQKTGMFGMAQDPFFTPASVLGDRAGGLFAGDTAFAGPQVRGTGFFHDGSVDTVHRFVSAAVFARTEGNPDALDLFLPPVEQQAACIDVFRSAPSSAVEAVDDPALREALALCSAAGPLPGVCFTEPASAECDDVLSQLGEQQGNLDFARVFGEQIRPLCFQLGSMIEGGASSGVCASESLIERGRMEKFVLAFDTNLKPMVGQQLTLEGRDDPLLLTELLTAVESGACDAALRVGGEGYLVTAAAPGDPGNTEVEGVTGAPRRLSELRRSGRPITITCYPPAPGRAEARRSAFDRLDGSVQNLTASQHRRWGGGDVPGVPAPAEPTVERAVRASDLVHR